MRAEVPDITDAAHRPWPCPAGPWAVRMVWHDLAFLHWPVPAEALASLVPRGLTIDRFEGRAWLGIVPFRMTGVAPRCVPDLPGVSAFCELNVRTYVVCDGRPGIWFHSLDAASRLAVRVARWRYHLPYHAARMRCRQDRDGWIDYESLRRDGRADFRARYRARGPSARAMPGTLEHWLVERYCLYAADARGTLYRSDVHHPPWDLQAADVELPENRLLEPLSLPAPRGAPLAHFAARLPAVAWPLSVAGLTAIPSYTETKGGS